MVRNVVCLEATFGTIEGDFDLSNHQVGNVRCFGISSGRISLLLGLSAKFFHDLPTDIK